MTCHCPFPLVFDPILFLFPCLLLRCCCFGVFLPWWRQGSTRHDKRGLRWKKEKATVDARHRSHPRHCLCGMQLFSFVFFSIFLASCAGQMPVGGFLCFWHMYIRARVQQKSPKASTSGGLFCVLWPWPVRFYGAVCPRFGPRRLCTSLPRRANAVDPAGGGGIAAYH